MRTKWLRRDERGSVLLIVVTFTLVAVVMTAAVVDLGGQREQRKELTLSTDSAALAAAGLAHTEDTSLTGETPGTLVDCDEVDIAPEAPQFERDKYAHVQEVVDYFLEENGESQPVECKVVRTGFKTGYVVVSADEIVDYKFAPAFGQSAGGVSGASVAAIEVDAGGGLRPVGICGAMEGMDGVDGYPEIALSDLWDSRDSGVPVDGGYSLDADGYVIDSAGVRNPFTARYPIEKVKGGSCGGGDANGAGNFGKLDFGGGTNTSCTEVGQFCKDYADGYYGSVPNPTNGSTGQFSNTNEDSTTNIEDNVGQFWAPVYTGVDATGENVNFDLAYFAQMEMVNHCFLGNCKFDGTTWFDFRVSRMLPFVPAGPPVTDDANLQPQRLCAMENDAAAIAAGCPQFVATTSTSAPASSIPDPGCEVASIDTINGAVTLTSGSPKVTEQDAVYDVNFVDISKCSALSYRVYRMQGQTETTGSMQSDPAVGDTVRITLPSGYAIASGTYEVQVLEALSVESPTGTLTVSNN